MNRGFIIDRVSNGYMKVMDVLQFSNLLVFRDGLNFIPGILIGDEFLVETESNIRDYLFNDLKWSDKDGNPLGIIIKRVVKSKSTFYIIFDMVGYPDNYYPNDKAMSLTDFINKIIDEYVPE